MITLFHNKHCSKSRECLKLIKNSNTKYKIINYMEYDISTKDIENIINGLIGPIEDLIRTNEPIIKNKLIKFNNKQDIINLLIKYKVCLQRPIVALENKYEICRPVGKVIKYLNSKTK